MEEKDLNEAQKHILAAAMEAGQKRMSPEEVAREAGCAVRTLSKHLKDPTFKSMFKEAMTSSITAETPAILHAFAAAAKQGQFKQGKLLLEIAGIYSEKATIDINAEVKQDTTFKDDSEREEFIKATLNAYVGKQEEEDEETAKEE